jgi:hypothetical protein
MSLFQELPVAVHSTVDVRREWLIVSNADITFHVPVQGRRILDSPAYRFEHV